jgi:hypothetical protein
MSYAPLDESGKLTNGHALRASNIVHHHSNSMDDDDVSNREGIGSGSVIDNDDRRKSLSEPLTSNKVEQQHLALSSDPFYVFRDDLYRQLDRVDETLTEYLRVVHQTVRMIEMLGVVLYGEIQHQTLPSRYF